MSRYNTIPPKNIDEYIAIQPQAFQQTLQEMRSIIHAVVPDAEEMISYRIPSFKYLYMLVGFGVSKDYCSFYTMSSTLTKKIKEALKGVNVSGSTLHFKPGEKLPVALIKKIVQIRLKENKERAMVKKAKCPFLPYGLIC